MKLQYANEFDEQLGMGDPKTCVYQLICNEKYSVDTYIIQYFIIHGLGLCIKVDGYEAYMSYAWSLSNNKAVPIAIHKNKYLLSLNTHTTLFGWGTVNFNKNKV